MENEAGCWFNLQNGSLNIEYLESLEDIWLFHRFVHLLVWNE